MTDMELESNYEISRVADFILTGNFSRVAFQFPDDQLKDSTRVVHAVREKIGKKREIGLYVMADTTYGSCCVDEVAASHINADSVIHFGHTCLSPTSNLPAFFVFGKASINVSECAKTLCNYTSTTAKSTLVLFGLEYGHAIQDIREASVLDFSKLFVSNSNLDLRFADVMPSSIRPSNHSNGQLGSGSTSPASDSCCKAGSTEYKIGGLKWSIPEGHSLDDYSLFWIGPDNSAFANVVLTFNACKIVRYDARENHLLTDFDQRRRILKRRYYLVEKAKDASIVGILVGTLGVAGYLHAIHQMKELITAAGKKTYTLVMGKPNPAKLANFPECDVFVFVSCAQTALLDSKEYLAPVITPFEAMLAFSRGCQWTGAYKLEFQDIMSLPCVEIRSQMEEGRFSFLQGGYVEDFDLKDTGNEEDNDEEALTLTSLTEKALQVRSKDPQSLLVKGTAKSAVEYLASRSFQGLDIQKKDTSPEPFFTGRAGRAAGYDGEQTKQ